jgi:hypothetical protein
LSTSTIKVEVSSTTPLSQKKKPAANMVSPFPTTTLTPPQSSSTPAKRGEERREVYNTSDIISSFDSTDEEVTFRKK